MNYSGMYAKTDEQWSKMVAERYQNQCTWPGCSSKFGLGAHHVVPRRTKDLRLYLDNGVLLCTEHHDVVESCKNTPKYDTYMLLLIGIKRYSKLCDMWRKSRDTVTRRSVVPEVSSEVEF